MNFKFLEILKIFVFLKCKLFDVIDELFGYNLYKRAKKVIGFFITSGFPGILKNVIERSRNFLLERDRKHYLCIRMKHQTMKHVQG